MEKTAELLKEVNEEVQESKRVLQELANEIRAIANVVNPALMEHVAALRANRMTLVQEVRESLAAMKEIRRFFLESDYETEMARLERFVRVCRDMRELIGDGTVDAVSDSAIRLAVKETK